MTEYRENQQQLNQADAYAADIEYQPTPKEQRELRAFQLGEHKGGFYFKRSFVTAFAILTAVSAFIAAWMIIWFVIISGIMASVDGNGSDQNMQDWPSEEPTSQTTDELGDPDPMPSGTEATCGPSETDPC